MTSARAQLETNVTRRAVAFGSRRLVLADIELSPLRVTSLRLGSADSSEMRAADPSLFVSARADSGRSPGSSSTARLCPDWSTDTGNAGRTRPPCSGSVSGIPSSKLPPGGTWQIPPLPPTPQKRLEAASRTGPFPCACGWWRLRPRFRDRMRTSGTWRPASREVDGVRP